MTTFNASTEHESPQFGMRHEYRNVGQVDRVVSTVTGGMLLLYGLRKRTPGALGLAVLGGSLVRRGVTGHSPVYEALHISTANGHTTDERRAQEWKVSESHSTTIDKPADELYRFWPDPANMPQIMDFVVSVSVRDETHSRWLVECTD